jgi:putative ABC transport system permease protein
MANFWLKLKRRRRMRQDLDDELAFHKGMAEEHGNLPLAPRGNETVIREQAYDELRFVFLENLWRDIVYAARGLRRSPALVFTALLSLALGVGVNTTIFSLGMEFLFSEPSVRDAPSVVAIRLGGNSHSSEKALTFVKDSGLFQDVAGNNEEVFVNWNDGVDTRPVFGVATSMNYFSSLGIPVEYGRGILPEDPKEVVVLSHDFWIKHFNSDPATVGRSINLDGRACTVVGVLPANHRTLIGFGFSPDLYMPSYLDSTMLAIYARLKPGMNRGEARAGLENVAQQLDKVYPESFKYSQHSQLMAVSGVARLMEQNEMLSTGVFLALLLGVTGLVLLIACINVASLLLARAAARRSEIATRLALGASRGRLLQQLLAESLLLSILGAAAGLAASQFTASSLAQLRLPLPVPIHLRIEPDWRLVAYAVFLTLFSTVACGLLPAWRSVKDSIAADFHRDGRMNLRRTLVAAQLAVSLIVLFTGFLFLHNLAAAGAMSPGFDVRNTLRAEVHLPPALYKDAQHINLYAGQAMRELGGIPGITAVAVARIVPFTDNTHYGSDLVFPATNRTVHATFQWNAVSPTFFQVMDIPILQGRAFRDDDRAGQHVVVVNRAFVKRYLGNQPPTGATFLWGAQGKTPYEIVGVVEGTKTITIGEDDAPQLYETLTQIANNRPRIQFVLRSAIPPARQVQPVHDALYRLDPAVGTEVATMYSSIGLAFLPSQVGGVLMGSIGVLALLLAAIGLYGVMVYSVARRTREIGVRMAIGATPGDITRLVLVDSAKLIGIGSAIGLLVSLLIAKPLTIFLVPGLKPADPLSFSAVLLALALTGLLATWGPVRRALAVDPMTSLRQD